MGKLPMTPALWLLSPPSSSCWIRAHASVLTSHLGRPKNEPDPAFSLKPVAARLSELLGKDVKFVSAAIGPEAEARPRRHEGR